MAALRSVKFTVKFTVTTKAEDAAGLAKAWEMGDKGGVPLRRAEALSAMRAAFDISAMVRKYSAIPFERLRLVQEIAEFPLAELRRGIVIVFAAWSGQSVMALQRLTRFLSQRKEAVDLADLVVIDIESMTTQDMKRRFGREFHGSGETLFIREGKVMGLLETYGPEAEAVLLNEFRKLVGDGAN